MKSLRQMLLKIAPGRAVLFAADLRCLLRVSSICGSIPYRKVENKPTLIVAPHPDDETFGCGGLISMKRSLGTPLCVVLLTNGEAVGSGRCESIGTVVAARRREFQTACQRLGLETNSLRFLNLPDSKLPHIGRSGFDAAVTALLSEIEAFAPDEVYCPHSLDVHADHVAAAQLTHRALQLWPQSCSLVYYSIWMWYHASSGLRTRLDTSDAWRLDISTVLSVKEHAMSAYLDAPKTSNGSPYCGRLPWSFLRNFRRKYEVYFPTQLDRSPAAIPVVRANAN